MIHIPTLLLVACAAGLLHVGLAPVLIGYSVLLMTVLLWPVGCLLVGWVVGAHLFVLKLNLRIWINSIGWNSRNIGWSGGWRCSRMVGWSGGWRRSRTVGWSGRWWCSRAA